MEIDIEKELEEAKERREQTVNQINELAQQRRALLQEALRLDGEVRRLQSMKDRATENPQSQKK